MSLSKCIGCAHYVRTPLTVVNGYANGFETDCALGREEFFSINGCDQYCKKIEYIPKDAIPYKEIKVSERCHNDVWDETILVAYKEDLDRFPAADVERIRHGKWRPCKSWNPDYEGFECSECGARFQGTHRDNYCGNCGAKMDAPVLEGVEDNG